eukprot:symbB.v1.2.013630.t1/scaffold970.1/size148061/3
MILQVLPACLGGRILSALSRLDSTNLVATPNSETSGGNLQPSAWPRAFSKQENAAAGGESQSGKASATRNEVSSRVEQLGFVENMDSQQKFNPQITHSIPRRHLVV